jgi:midasin
MTLSLNTMGSSLYQFQSECLIRNSNRCLSFSFLLMKLLMQPSGIFSTNNRYLSDVKEFEVGRAQIFSNDHVQIIEDTVDLKFTVNVAGVLLPHEKLFKEDYVPQHFRSNFVLTSSAYKALSEIASSLSCGLPILLEGSAGVGKTSLIEEAGKMVGAPELLKIHLGDQTDGKLLLGTYMTTSTPGQFKWQPGVLTTAVTEGRWILFEDIDMAPVDVIAVLLPLLETGWLHIPSRGERHRAKEGFHIFATRKLNKSSRSGKAIVGENLWIKLLVPEIDHNDISTILSTRFPSIQAYLDQMLSVYELLITHFPAVNGRQICVRDLMKWCERVTLLNIAQTDPSVLRELFFREAYDCFVAMIAVVELREALCVYLAESLGITEHRKEYLLYHYVPEVENGVDFVKYGRALLPTKISYKAVSDENTFATTSSSLKNLERIGVAVKLVEPLLLVGETGTGKTTIVQKLASSLGRKLTVLNMSQQSDSTDLLGGFKPIDILMLASPLKDRFSVLFEKTFSVKQNTAFLDIIHKTYTKKKWDHLIAGFKNAFGMAQKLFAQQTSRSGGESPKKIRKILDQSLLIEWENFNRAIQQFKAQVHQIRNNFLFSFVEGALVRAIKNGEWVLLDEINLATAETLESLSSLLQSSTGSVLLLERGDSSAIERHPDFRLFACMNPANDAGKRNLPDGLRSRFTEFWIDAPDSNIADLLLIVNSYIGKYLPPGPSGEQLCKDVADFYRSTKALSSKNLLFDGADQRFHVSLRTLTRALSCSALIAPVYGIRRSLFEGCYMTFLTGLGSSSLSIVTEHLFHHILSGVKNPAAFVKQIPNSLLEQPESYDTPYVLIDCFRLEKGPLHIPEDSDMKFVLTPSVDINLRNLARGCITRKYPILIQGPTSAGKTSIIEYLAKKTGHRFIRINNHEHTDMQEYLGGYVSNDQGALVFQEVHFNLF